MYTPCVCLSDVLCCTFITIGVHRTCGGYVPSVELWRSHGTDVNGNKHWPWHDAKYDEGKLSFTAHCQFCVDLLTILGIYNPLHFRTRRPVQTGITPALSPTQSQTRRRVREAEWRLWRSGRRGPGGRGARQPPGRGAAQPAGRQADRPGVREGGPGQAALPHRHPAAHQGGGDQVST